MWRWTKFFNMLNSAQKITYLQFYIIFSGSPSFWIIQKLGEGFSSRVYHCTGQWCYSAPSNISPPAGLKADILFIFLVLFSLFSTFIRSVFCFWLLWPSLERTHTPLGSIAMANVYHSQFANDQLHGH